MNRTNRFSKLSYFIKQAAKKAENETALKAIFKAKYPQDNPKKVEGLAVQYNNFVIGVRDPEEPVITIADISLPDTLGEVQAFIKEKSEAQGGSKNERLANEIKARNPGVKLEGFGEDYLSWLHQRYVTGKGKQGEIIHPIAEAIPTLNLFKALQNKVSSSPELKKKLSDNGFDNISSIRNYSIEDMERAISLDTTELSVRVEGVEIGEKEFLGKFGEWNVWLPHTKETSTKIAGYDPVTYEPKTTWCTGRTKGSNLFYNYIGRSDAPSFLFYIIKDNPIAKSNQNDSEEVKAMDNDWLSLGYASYGGNLTPVWGEDGGLTVNRANKGLTEYDFEVILGDQWDPIQNRIKQEMENFKFTKENGRSYYESPGRKVILFLAKNVEEFKKEFEEKSNAEKEDFSGVIMGADPADGVKVEIFKWMSRHDPSYFLNTYRKQVQDLGLDDLIKQAFISLAEKNPYEFFEKYRDEVEYLGLNDLIKQALRNLAEKNPDYFLNSYKKEAEELGLNDLRKKALEDLAEKDPQLFLDAFIKDAQDLGLNELVKKSLTNYAQKNPNSFLVNYNKMAQNLGFNELVKETLEDFAEKEPSLFLGYHKSLAESLGLVDSIKIALEYLLKKYPSSGAFRSYMSDIKKFGLEDLLPQAYEERKKTLEINANKNASDFLTYHTHEAIFLGANHLIDEAKKTRKKELQEKLLNNPEIFIAQHGQEAKRLGFEDLINKAKNPILNLEELAVGNPYFFLTHYKNAAKNIGLDHLIPMALENVAQSNPRFFIDEFLGLAKSLNLNDLIVQAFKNIAKNYPDLFNQTYRSAAERSGIRPEELTAEGSYLENHLIKLARSLESIGCIKEAYAISSFIKSLNLNDKKINKSAAKFNPLGLGAGLLLSLQSCTPGETPEQHEAHVAAKEEAGEGESEEVKTHTVASGETIESIAELYGVTPRDIRRINNKRSISNGDVIKIPNKSSTPEDAMGDWFSRRELQHTDRSAFRDRNIADEESLEHLDLLTEKVLDPIRYHFGTTVNIESGYRSPELNRTVGGADDSDHLTGQSADIKIPGYTSEQLAAKILSEMPELEFDQLIWYSFTGHVHISYVEGRNRKEVLKASKNKNKKTVYSSIRPRSGSSSITNSDAPTPSSNQRIESPQQAAPSRTNQPAPQAVWIRHTVRRGDSLSELAVRYNCSVRDIKSWNNLSESKILIGQKLKIKKPV